MATSSDLAANSYGLVFSISPAKKQAKKKDQDEDEENILTLAPFTKPPKINFGQLKINESVERSVLIINPQQFDLELTVTNNDLNINNIILNIEKGQNVNLKIKWQPDKAGNFKFSILFEVTNSARLKFLVHAFGVCIKPEEKKIRKPLNMLQPLRSKEKPQSTSTSTTTTTTTTSIKYKSSTTTIIKKTLNQTKNKFDQTVILDNKENSKKLQSNSVSIEFSKPEINIKPIELDSTPKLEAFQTPAAPSTNVQLTPKLSDFLKPQTYTDDLNSSITTTTTTTTTSKTCTKLTTIASTKLIDISIDQENSKINMIQSGPKTPHYSSFMSSKYNSSIFLNESVIKRVEEKDIPVMNKDYLYEDCSFVEKEDENIKLEKYVVVVQKQWRMNKFRKCLKDLKYKEKTEKLNKLLSNSKNLFLEFDLLNRKQEEFVEFQKQEKQKMEQKLVEMEKLENERKLKLLNSVLLIQRKWRYNQFSKSLKILKLNLLIKSVLLIQRKWRYRKFRKCLKYLKEQNDYEIKLKLKYTLLIQKCFRIKKIKRKELENNSARIIQHKWRLFRFRQEMNKYRCSAKIIQNFYKNQIKPRLNFLKLKSICLKIEAIYIGKKTRREYLLKRESCMKIQYWFRAKLVRLNFLKLKSSCIKIQRFYRYKKFSHCLNKFRTSLIKIQKWTRSMKQRFEYLNYKRVVLKCVVKIQTYWRCYKSKQILKQLKQEKLMNKSALKIQSYWKCYKSKLILKQLKQEKLMNKSALKIQSYWKCYKSKLILKQFKQEKLMNKSALKIQSYWKCFKSRQQLNNLKKINLENKSAVLIQKMWKGYSTRCKMSQIIIEQKQQIQMRHEQNKLNSSATKIQAYWRGYKVRKETNQVLCSIRNRLSIYQTNVLEDSNSTLGSRIKNSLKILKYPCVPIQQIIMALSELDKVTSLSRECCLLFTREGAIDILYTFILNCNRSVPHMDLIKYCLQIFINLSKYSQTVEYILKPAGSLNILSNLLQAYQSTNPQIFMDTCIIFVLLSQNDSIKEYILRQEIFIKKLIGIYSALERRANLRERQTGRTNLLQLAKEQLNSTLNQSNVGLNSNKKSVHVTFKFVPEWSLGKKSSVELIDPIGAIEYLMDTLDLERETSLTSNNYLSSKTPKKSLSTSSIDKSGKKIENKSNKKLACFRPGSNSKATSSKQLFKTDSTSKSESIEEEVSFVRQEETIMCQEYEMDESDLVSVCSNESYRSTSTVKTFKSTSSLNETSTATTTTTTATTRLKSIIPISAIGKSKLLRLNKKSDSLN